MMSHSFTSKFKSRLLRCMQLRPGLQYYLQSTSSTCQRNAPSKAWLLRAQHTGGLLCASESLIVFSVNTRPPQHQTHCGQLYILMLAVMLIILFSPTLTHFGAVFFFYHTHSLNEHSTVTVPWQLLLSVHCVQWGIKWFSAICCDWCVLGGKKLLFETFHTKDSDSTKLTTNGEKERRRMTRNNYFHLNK